MRLEPSMKDAYEHINSFFLKKKKKENTLID